MPGHDAPAPNGHDAPAPNPYAAPVSESSEDRSAAAGLAFGGAGQPALKLWIVVVRWTVVCTLSAAPSFLFGLSLTQSRVGGMLTGVLIFIVAYVWLDRRTASAHWRQSTIVRRLLKTVYGLRVGASILFPIGMYADLMCGVVSVGIYTRLGGTAGRGETMGYFDSLVVTLLQGLCLHVVLTALGLLLLPVYALFMRRRSDKSTDEDAARRYLIQAEATGQENDLTQTEPEAAG